MNNLPIALAATSITNIPLHDLALSFLPVLVVLVILWKWNAGVWGALYAMVRMVVQLVLLGYFLEIIFNAKGGWGIVAVLTVMLLSASWIGLRTASMPRMQLFGKAFLAITLGGGTTLALITQGVLRLSPWYLPEKMIPLAGMIFAGAMTSISLCIDRLQVELSRNAPYHTARIAALKSALIPITNSLFAVGLVSIPGMMTGQILANVSPFIAARYQIMVMCMIFGAAGMSAACFLKLAQSDFEKQCDARKNE